MIHCTRELETIVGDDCTIGHLAHLEGCTVEDGALVGTGSIVLHRAIVRTRRARGRGRGGARRHGGAERRDGARCAREAPARRGEPDQIDASRRGSTSQLGALPHRAPPPRLKIAVDEATDFDTAAALDETLAFLTLRPAGERDDVWIGDAPDWFGDYLFGGFVIAQSIAAATRHAPGGPATALAACVLPATRVRRQALSSISHADS